jgi:hypothetical protein
MENSSREWAGAPAAREALNKGMDHGTLSILIREVP